MSFGINLVGSLERQELLVKRGRTEQKVELDSALAFFVPHIFYIIYKCCNSNPIKVSCSKSLVHFLGGFSFFSHRRHLKRNMEWQECGCGDSLASRYLSFHQAFGFSANFRHSICQPKIHVNLQFVTYPASICYIVLFDPFDRYNHKIQSVAPGQVGQFCFILLQTNAFFRNIEGLIYNTK